jgi:two-component system response regulator (stage 0 sporulation protein F)
MRFWRPIRRAKPCSREPFDLVIVDVFMPGMDGYQAIKEFQRLDPGVPIIAMSGVIFRESSQRHAPDFLGMAGKLGATRTLHKPFKPAELIEAVGACVEARARHFDMRTTSSAAG